jgi:hypothetical protein
MNIPFFPEARIALKGKNDQQYEAAIPRIANAKPASRERACGSGRS